MNKVRFFALAAAAALVPLLASAQGMMSGGAGTPNGTGMVTVASDGSILVTQMGMTMMGSPGGSGSASLQRAVVDLGATGTQRWRATFATGWPMMAGSNGDLVVVVVLNNAWMWRSLSGMGWFPFGTTPQSGTQDASLVGLDLATGAQRWSARLSPETWGRTRSSPPTAPGFTSVTDFGQAGMMGSGSMAQGDTGNWATQMTNKIVALDRAGNILWTTDLSQSGGMMTP